MWYVNLPTASSTALIITSFYINYVVCKLCSNRTKSTLLFSFILTMWYVNFVLFSRTYVRFMGFILTMWYVNHSGQKQYIANSFSFILTMWYVNIQDKNISSLRGAGFILTMWYVNEWFAGIGDKIKEFYINYVVCK